MVMSKEEWYERIKYLKPLKTLRNPTKGEMVKMDSRILRLIGMDEIEQMYERLDYVFTYKELEEIAEHKGTMFERLCELSYELDNMYIDDVYKNKWIRENFKIWLK